MLYWLLSVNKIIVVVVVVVKEPIHKEQGSDYSVVVHLLHWGHVCLNQMYMWAAIADYLRPSAVKILYSLVKRLML